MKECPYCNEATHEQLLSEATIYAKEHNPMLILKILECNYNLRRTNLSMKNDLSMIARRLEVFSQEMFEVKKENRRLNIIIEDLENDKYLLNDIIKKHKEIIDRFAVSQKGTNG